MNKKIVMSLSVIGAVAAVVVGGTSAFFSDSETSIGNTFTAGAIDLKIDSKQIYNGNTCGDDNRWEGSAAYPVPGTSCTGAWAVMKDLVPGVDKFFNFGDIKPGDNGSNSISLHVISNDAYMCAAVTNLNNDDLGLTEPESDVDGTDGPGNGELQQNMLVTIWQDDGDNILGGTETVLYGPGPAQEGMWPLYTPSTGALTGGDTAWLGVKWELPFATGNAVQTDSLTADISFKVEQARNNAGFTCGSETVVVTADDLAETPTEVVNSNFSKWLFYNDVNDTVMTINQFGGDGGTNDIVAGPGAVGAAQMTLHDALARYNIATYKYKNVKLSDINSLNYRIYDATASSETPYLHFNVDWANSDAWQGRLVQVPTGVSADTWTTVNALTGMWTKTSGNWPTGVTTVSPFDGSTPRSWADIVADYPNAETRSTDSFFGVRVGHPGPDNATGYVDWIEFDGETTDFEN